MEFVASTFIEDGTLELRLDGQVVLRNSGRVSIKLEEGLHEVSWRVEGKMGTSFTISISSPASAEFHLTKVITEDDYKINLTTFKI